MASTVERMSWTPCTAAPAAGDAGEPGEGTVPSPSPRETSPSPWGDRGGRTPGPRGEGTARGEGTFLDERRFNTEKGIVPLGLARWPGQGAEAALCQFFPLRD